MKKLNYLVKVRQNQKKAIKQKDLKYALWKWVCHRRIVGFGSNRNTLNHTENTYPLKLESPTSPKYARVSV